MTAAPLRRILDNGPAARLSGDRGWAWLFLVCGLMKVRSAFSNAHAAADTGGWAFLAQALSLSVEGFFHKAVDRPQQVVVSTVGGCLAMFAWLRALADQEKGQQQALPAPGSAPAGVQAQGSPPALQKL